MRFSLAKCCSWKAGKIERDFEKMKWHVKMHEKMPFNQRKRSDIFAPFGVQSNLDCPDLDYPDFSIIRTFSSGPNFVMNIY